MSAHPISGGQTTHNALANDLSKISAANAAFLKKPGKLLIDGRWVDAQTGRTFEVRNPSGDQVIAWVAEGEAADIDAAVAAVSLDCGRHRVWQEREALGGRCASVLRTIGQDRQLSGGGECVDCQ